MKKILLILALTAIPAISLGIGCGHAKFTCSNNEKGQCPKSIIAPTWRIGLGCGGHWDNQKPLCEAACPGWDFSNGWANDD